METRPDSLKKKEGNIFFIRVDIRSKLASARFRYAIAYSACKTSFLSIFCRSWNFTVFLRAGFISRSRTRFIKERKVVSWSELTLCSTFATTRFLWERACSLFFFFFLFTIFVPSPSYDTARAKLRKMFEHIDRWTVHHQTKSRRPIGRFCLGVRF